MNKSFKTLGLLILLFLTACSKNDPGPILGVWTSSEFQFKVAFREGETETLGFIEKVEYEVQGNDVIVTYTDGLAKGTAMRYTVVDKNTLKTEMDTLHRVQ